MMPFKTMSSAQTPRFQQLSKFHQPNSSPNNSSFTHHIYEPTSVLDPHLSSSPASAAAGEIPALAGLLSDPWEPPLSDAWDSVAWLLGGGEEKDDSAPPLKPVLQFPFITEPATVNSSLLPFPPLSDDSFDDLPPHASPLDFDNFFNQTAAPAPTPPHNDQAYLDQLIQAVHAVESDDLLLADVILARLNHHLATPSGKPVQRAVFYFREALHSLLPIPNRPIAEPLLSPVEIVRRISAYKALSDLSPVPQFASFTANQTVLEALDGSRTVHLIDFEIGLGGQWSSFMHEIAHRCRSARVAPPSVRITAVVPEESLETNLTADNLRDFASGLGVSFSIEFVRVGELGTVALGAIRISAGESVAVSFTPGVVRLLGAGTESATSFLRFVRRVSPRVVVFVDTESGCRSANSGPPPPSFRRSFVTALEYYTVLLESLDAAAFAVGFGDDLVRRIERSLIRPKVFVSVGSCGTRLLPWREMFEGAGIGMKPVSFSESTELQAEWLTRRAPIGGFHVARREGAMVLSWQGRELAATSAWRC